GEADMVANVQSSLPQPMTLRHALVVDDEPQVRSFVSKALASAGFVSHECARVTEVEAALTQYRPEIIVLDLSLAGSDGVEMMRSLASARFRGKVLLVSGHTPATLVEAQKIGARRGLDMLEPLQKPFRVEDIRLRLAQVAEPMGNETGRA